MSDDEFRNYFKESKEEEFQRFAKSLYYQNGDFTEKDGYQNLDKKLKGIDDEMGACIARFFYLATPPHNYETILDNLVETKLSEGCGHGSSEFTRVIIEKPFGKDLETAQSLDKKLADTFDEKQIFRVDHYLGKETVQNMIAFRFANGIFEPVWNKNFIDHVQITLSEEEGVVGREKFFEGIGMLRDMAQNHLLQLLSAIAMEQPKSFSKDDLRDSRANVASSIRQITPENISESVVRGQYKSYKKENGIPQSSETETFVAMKLFIDTERFQGVPFYLRAGKKLKKNVVEISVVFIQTCHILFKEYGCPEIGNVITFRIQPDEGISLRFIAKKPGAKLGLESVSSALSRQ